MAKQASFDADSAYFLKLLVYVVLGTVWLQFDGRTVVPVGLAVGLLLAQHDHFKIDRKIEYAVLLIATLVAFVAGRGFFLNLTGVSF
jgi:hypothetical protein